MIKFLKEKGLAVLLLSVIFTFSSLFWTSDIVYNHGDLSSIELGWPFSFVIQDHSQLDPPEWWFPHKIGFGLPQEYPTPLNLLLFGFSIVLNFLIIFSIVFVVLKFNPRLLFLKKIISVKYIVGGIGATLFAFISLFIYAYITRLQINTQIQPLVILPPPPPLENKMEMKIDRAQQSNQSSDIQKIIAEIPSWSIDESQTQGWKKYTSQKLGISFKYPKNYLVVEAKETTTPAIGESFSLVILEDNQYNRHYAKTINADFDYGIPENQKNTDIEPQPGMITLMKTVAEYDFAKNGLARGIGDRSIFGSTNFLGIGATAYLSEGLFTFEGIIFEKERYTYQFDVAYDSQAELARSDFYKIISTVKFE